MTFISAINFEFYDKFLPGQTWLSSITIKKYSHRRKKPYEKGYIILEKSAIYKVARSIGNRYSAPVLSSMPATILAVDFFPWPGFASWDLLFPPL